MAISGATSIISKLGDSAGSIVPVIAKDTGNSLGVTLLHRKHGSEQDGKEKAIEEFGTQIIWLGGIPLIKKAFDLTAYKIAGIDPRFDVRKLNPKSVDNIGVMMKQAQETGLNDQLAMLKKIEGKKGLSKVLFASKFAAATAATLVALTALIKFKQKTTEKYMYAKVEKQIAEEKHYDEHITKSLGKNNAFQAFQGTKRDNAQNVVFKGTGAALGEFMFNPLKNMSLLDVGIFTTRVSHGRKGEKFEIGLKEVMNFSFIYLLATPIQKGLEKIGAKVMKRPIDLDYRVLSDKGFKQMIKDDSLKKAAKSFAALEDDAIIGHLFKKGSKHDVFVDLLKRTGEVKTLKNGDVSALHLIDPKKLKQTAANMLGMLEAQGGKSGIDVDKFISQTRKLKAGSIFANIGIAILFVGILQPLISIGTRKIRSKGETGNNLAFKEVEAKVRNSLS